MGFAISVMVWIFKQLVTGEYTLFYHITQRLHFFPSKSYFFRRRLQSETNEEWCRLTVGLQIRQNIGILCQQVEKYYGCSRLSSLTIPESVRSIERGAFAICSGLTQMTVQAIIPPMVGDNHFLRLVVTYPCMYPPKVWKPTKRPTYDGVHAVCMFVFN